MVSNAGEERRRRVCTIKERINDGREQQLVGIADYFGSGGFLDVGEAKRCQLVSIVARRKRQSSQSTGSVGDFDLCDYGIELRVGSDGTYTFDSEHFIGGYCDCVMALVDAVHYARGLVSGDCSEIAGSGPEVK